MIQSIRGFRDILPGEAELWRKIQRIASDLFENFGFKEIRLPIMERSELFARSIGENTDIVEKEMYTFSDKGKEWITLRPEATASMVRAYIQHKMHAANQICKSYTIGPMFRRERPQKGRHRQFYQINAEVFGEESPFVDVSLIFMLKTLLSRLKVDHVEFHINSLGCPECRPAFTRRLKQYLEPKKETLCADCLKRRVKNPLRVLDCKVPSCGEAAADAPLLTDFLCPDCQSHFQTVTKTLEKRNVPFIIDKKLVRGLDYYTRTTFEVHTGALGAQSAVAGGGRYDGLVKALGGPDQPGIGFAIGFDRLAEIVGLKKEDCVQTPDLFIAALGPTAMTQAFDWICDFGAKGIAAEMDFQNRSLKSQMKLANRLKASHVMIIGDDEIEKGEAIVRDMTASAQVSIPLKGIVTAIEPILNRG